MTTTYKNAPTRTVDIDGAKFAYRQLTNRELTDQLALAVATIQRLSLDNHQLRVELEAPRNVSRISTGPRRR